ncbi:hypothetical protein [Bradyrhizobium sp. Pha-3]|uniref:hypothetical protein n=1 Tax=Bradyrhizobium TaxID=374 RepID=UPI0035D40929
MGKTEPSGSLAFARPVFPPTHIASRTLLSRRAFVRTASKPDVVDRSNERIINTKEFCRILDGIHPHTLMRRMKKDKRFPPPIPTIRLNGHHWYEADAYAYREAPRVRAA